MSLYYLRKPVFLSAGFFYQKAKNMEGREELCGDVSERKGSDISSWE
jgi:hypothetical protein